jgi:hypothetical protein
LLAVTLALGIGLPFLLWPQSDSTITLALSLRSRGLNSTNALSNRVSRSNPTISQPDEIIELEASPPPSPSPSDSSESDDSVFFSKPKMSSSITTTLFPTVEHYVLHHAPLLTAGVPNAAILLEFEDACEDFFSNAEGGIADDVKVTRILPSFKDPIIRGWISSDHRHLASLCFTNF